MEWIKLYTGKWLYGSGRTMTAEQRGVWADLMALAAETKFRDGSLRFEVNRPMSREYISGVLQIPLELLNSCLEVFSNDLNKDSETPRISISSDGTITLSNFLTYQDLPADKKKLTGRELELVQRKQLNTLAEKYPIEAANVPAVKNLIQEELSEKNTTKRKS